MIATPGTFARAGIVLFLATVLQISGIAQFDVLGSGADLIPLAVLGLAFYGGSVAGASSGFAAGLLLDLALGHTAGISSLVLTAVGYGAGRYRELKDPAHGLAPIPFAALGTLGYLLALAAVSFMLGVDAVVSPFLVLQEIVVAVLLNAVLALPFFWLLGRVLRGSLVSDPTVRGRRQRTREAGPIGLRGLEVKRGSPGL